MNSLISAYKDLIVLFVNKKEISALKFETEFLKLFKGDKSCDADTYEIIKPLFYAVEDFCSNPELREKDDLDEDQLAEVAKATFEKLEEVYLLDDKSLQNSEYDANIEEIVEKKLNEILPAIVKNSLSEELHKLMEIHNR